MEWSEWIALVFQTSLFLTVFCIGVKASHRDALFLFRHPRALLISVLSMAVIMPAFVVVATLLLDFHPAVEIALIALSVSPVPPFLPLRAIKSGGKPEYIISLLVITAVLSVLVVPLAVAVFSRIYAVQAHLTPMDILPVVLISVLLPLALGLASRALAPSLAKKLAGRFLPSLAMVLLLVSMLLILFDLRDVVFDLVRASTLITLGGFALLGFMVGDLLGGMNAEDRTVLAFATAMRHPGVALSMAEGPGGRGEQMVFAAILVYLVLGLLASMIYMAGRRRFETGSGTAVPVG